MKTVTQTLEIPESKFDFLEMPLFQQEYKNLNTAWNITVSRTRISRRMTGVIQKRAEAVLELFVLCGAMLRTLKQLPLEVFDVSIDTAIENLDKPYSEVVREMWDYLKHYPNDWHTRDIEMFPIHDFDYDDEPVNKYYINYILE